MSSALVPLLTRFLAQATEFRLSEMSMAETLKSHAQARLCHPNCLGTGHSRPGEPCLAELRLSEKILVLFSTYLAQARKLNFWAKIWQFYRAQIFCHFSQLRSTCTRSNHDHFSAIKPKTHIKPFFNSFFIIPKGFPTSNLKSSYQTQISQFGQNKETFSIQ